MKSLVSSTVKALLENDKIISDNKAVLEIFNDYFANVISSLRIEETESSVVSTDDIDDPIALAIIKCSLHIILFPSNFK